MGLFLSIIGAVRTANYMLHVLTTSGFKQSVCDPGFYSAPVSKFWAYAFVLSKAPELGKTSCFLTVLCADVRKCSQIFILN